MNQSGTERQDLLRRALRVNALFSASSGLAILFADRWLVRFLGLPAGTSLTVVGASLIVYAAILWFNARRPTIRIPEAWIAVVMDTVWVVGSYVLIFALPFSVGGKWVVAVVAELVLIFAIVQWLGIQRIRKAKQYA